MNANARRYPRINVGWPGAFDLGDGRYHRVKVVNASVAGMGLHCDRNLPIGTRLKLVVTVPNNRMREAPVNVPMIITVVHCIIERDHFNVGVEIDQISPEGRQMLKTYIDQHL